MNSPYIPSPGQTCTERNSCRSEWQNTRCVRSPDEPRLHGALFLPQPVAEIALRASRWHDLRSVRSRLHARSAFPAGFRGIRHARSAFPATSMHAARFSPRPVAEYALRAFPSKCHGALWRGVHGDVGEGFTRNGLWKRVRSLFLYKFVEMSSQSDASAAICQLLRCRYKFII